MKLCSPPAIAIKNVGATDPVARFDAGVGVPGAQKVSFTVV